jgi:hypothetical protein
VTAKLEHRWKSALGGLKVDEEQLAAKKHNTMYWVITTDLLEVHARQGVEISLIGGLTEVGAAFDVRRSRA